MHKKLGKELRTSDADSAPTAPAGSVTITGHAPTIDVKPAPGGVRSAVVGVRLDPKLKYLAEIGARSDRRTLSSYIENAVENAVRQTRISFLSYLSDDFSD